MSAPRISFENVSFGYPGQPALFGNVCLHFHPGEFISIQGESGAGKSTLLRLMARFEEATSGTIMLEDTNITDLPPPALRTKIQYIQQIPTLTAGSVRHNLLLPFEFKANSHLTPPSDDILRLLMDEYQLSRIELDRSAGNLSVGQKQRLCLIRAMLLSPLVMLMDEPTSALDDASAEIVLNAARHLSRKKGVTVFIVTHGSAIDKFQTTARMIVENNEVRRT